MSRYRKIFQNNGRDISKGGVPNTVEMVREEPADVGRHGKKRGGEVAQRRHSERVSSIGERSPARIILWKYFKIV